MASTEFRRTGPLKELASYPQWLQKVVHETNPDKERFVKHPLFTMMRDAVLPLPQVQKFLSGIWLTIERFPQFMAMNLQKMHVGNSVGADMARRFLIQNIRVEQKHADYWLAWAKASGLTLDDLKFAGNCIEEQALAHWCWYISAQPSLVVGVAATNYAVEGATGEWSALVCSKDEYANSFPESCRTSAMRWLRVHAEYDDTHPWEALDIVATIMGQDPPKVEIDEVCRAIRASFNYMELAVDGVLKSQKSRDMNLTLNSILREDKLKLKPDVAGRRNRSDDLEKSVPVS